MGRRRRSVAGGAVDGFAEQVGVAAVAGVLLDHVDDRAPQAVAGVGPPERQHRRVTVSARMASASRSRSSTSAPGRARVASGAGTRRSLLVARRYRDVLRL